MMMMMIDISTGNPTPQKDRHGRFTVRNETVIRGPQEKIENTSPRTGMLGGWREKERDMKRKQESKSVKQLGRKRDLKSSVKCNGHSKHCKKGIIKKQSEMKKYEETVTK